MQRSVALSFPKQGKDGREVLKMAARGMDLGLGAGKEEQNEEAWAKEMEEVKALFAELIAILEDRREKSQS